MYRAVLEDMELPVADEVLNEKPDLREKSLAELRRLLEGDASLDCPSSDEFLLKFLRARKYRVQDAFTNVQNYFRLRQEEPEILENLTPSTVPYDAVCRQNKLLAISRKRDSLGRAVALLRVGAWNTDICSFNELLRTGVLIADWFLMDEEVQKRGVVYVLDFKGLGAHHVMQCTPSVCKRAIKILQDCYPVRPKAFYVVNNSPVFDVIFAIAKVFLKPKTADRIHLLGYDLEKLQDLVPLDVIPEEAGGTFESYDYDELENDLLSSSHYFEDLNRYGYGKESTHF